MFMQRSCLMPRNTRRYVLCVVVIANTRSESCTARPCQLSTVACAMSTESWLLKSPETLPAECLAIQEDSGCQQNSLHSLSGHACLIVLGLPNWDNVRQHLPLLDSTKSGTRSWCWLLRPCYKADFLSVMIPQSFCALSLFVLLLVGPLLYPDFYFALPTWLKYVYHDAAVMFVRGELNTSWQEAEPDAFALRIGLSLPLQHGELARAAFRLISSEV